MALLFFQHDYFDESNKKIAFTKKYDMNFNYISTQNKDHKKTKQQKQTRIYLYQALKSGSAICALYKYNFEFPVMKIIFTNVKRSRKINLFSYLVRALEI